MSAQPDPNDEQSRQDARLWRVLTGQAAGADLCSEFAELLPLYAAKGTRAMHMLPRVHAHVSECDACLAEVISLRATAHTPVSPLVLPDALPLPQSSSRQVPSDSPAASMAGSVSDSVAANAGAPPRRSAQARSLSLLHYVAAGSIMLLAVSVSVHLLQDQRPEQYIYRVAQLPDADARARLPQVGQAGWRRAGLFAGVDSYAAFNRADIENLHQAERDVDEAQRVFIAQGGAARASTLHLTGALATESGLRSSVNWLAATMNQPGDLVLLHLACHAWRGGQGEPRVLCADSRDSSGTPTGLPVSEVLRPLRDSRATTVLVLDTCFSGSVTPAMLGPRQWVVASSSAAQLARDGAFAKHWLQAFSFQSAAAGKDGVLTLREAFDAVARALKAERSSQEPLLIGPPGGDASQVVLALAEEVRHQLPPPGTAPAAPAQVRLELPAGQWLSLSTRPFAGSETQPLGVLVGDTTLFFPGQEQRFTFKRMTLGGAGESWTQDTGALTADTLSSLRVSLPATALHHRPQSLPLIGPPGSVALFPLLQSSNAVADLSWQWNGGVLRIHAKPGTPAGTRFMALAASATNGVDIAQELGLASGAMVRFSVDVCLANDPGEETLPVVVSVGGRPGESLEPRVEHALTLRAGWQVAIIEVPANKLTRLLSGLTLELRPASTRLPNAVVIELRSPTVRAAP